MQKAVDGVSSQRPWDEKASRLQIDEASSTIPTLAIPLASQRPVSNGWRDA
jgi:hypothetical protein